MKLYEINRDSLFRIEGDETQDVFTLDHIDGMYSLCYDQHGQIVHISAFAPVEVVINVP